MRTMRITVTGYVDLQDDVHVGDELDLRLKVLVYGLRDDLVDVTDFASQETKVIPGERNAELLVLRELREKK